MKILVVSLLRMGDLVMITPTLAGLKKKYPEAELHLLTNRENEKIVGLLDGIHRTHYFDRQLIQSSLGDVNRSLFEAYDRTVDLIRRLNEIEFNIVINLTQNRLSGIIAGEIQCETRTGLNILPQTPVGFGSPWFRHLNDMAVETGSRTFHYSDLFYFAAGLEEPPGPYRLRSDEGDRFGDVAPGIAVHMWSSDTKKDWSAANWIRLFKSLRALDDQRPLYVIGAPQDQSRLDEFALVCEQSGVSVEPYALNFSELIAFLNKMRGLVTVDTSVKHVAATTSVKIVELVLGSADYRKTGVYKDNSLIIAAQTECFPCSHFSACSQTRHLCGEQIDAQAAAAAIDRYMRSDWISLKTLAEEYEGEMLFLRTIRHARGFWLTEDLSPSGRETLVKQMFQLAGWRMTLDREYLKPVEPIGTEGRYMAEALRELNAEVILGRLESEWRQLEMALDRVIAHYSSALAPTLEFDKEFLIELKQLESALGYRGYISQNLADIKKNGLFSVKRLRDSLNELRQQNIAKIRILNAARDSSLEGGRP